MQFRSIIALAAIAASIIFQHAATSDDAALLAHVSGDLSKAKRLAESDKPLQAIDLLSQTIQSNPDVGLPYFFRAVLLQQVERHDKAIQDLSSAIEKGVQHESKAYAARGTSRFRLRQFHRAASDFEKALELDGNLVVALLGQSTVRYELEDYEGALADYDRVLQIDPDNELAFMGRSFCRLRMDVREFLSTRRVKTLAVEKDGYLSYDHEE